MPWEFLRNDKTAARNFFDPSTPSYKQNQFGGTFGGPLRLPRYNGRDRKFFFSYYEGFRSRLIGQQHNCRPNPGHAQRRLF
jgi:hypothetical protein